MSNMGTFGAFTTARLGIYAAQKGLDITGHNIANINTPGYTRQRLDQISLRLGGADRYASSYDVNPGTGVLVTGISQLRDPYLDIRFRNEQSSLGAMDAKMAGLEELQSIFDEVYKGTDHGGVVEDQFNDLITQLENLSGKVGQEEFDGLVRSSAKTLTQLLKSYSDQLNTIQENQEANFKQDLTTVNGLLDNIRELNDSIQKSDLHGDPALELKDQRNTMIDELSKYMKINIEYQSVSVGAGSSLDKLVIKTAGPPQYTLVDGSYSTNVSIQQVPQENPDSTGPDDKYIKPDGTFTGNADEAALCDSPNYDLTFGEMKNEKGALWEEKKTTTQGTYGSEAERDSMLDQLMANLPAPEDQNGIRTTVSYEAVQKTLRDGSVLYSIEQVVRHSSTPVQVGDTDLYGSLQATREILTEAGEFTSQDTVDNIDSGAATKRGIPFYQKSLDALAQKLASVLNEANTGYLRDDLGNYVDTSGNPITYTQDGQTLNLNKDTPLTDDLRDLLAANGVAMGGPLFSNSSDGNDTTGITAANISISQDWSVGDLHIVNSFVKGTDKMEPNSTDPSNILHILVCMKDNQSYSASDINPDAVGGPNTHYFNGSFQGMLARTCSTLADDVKITTAMLENYSSKSDEINGSRDSVSSVDLNDEATNLMQYQKSYAAACRLMTTLDEALDKLINGTGVVGR